AIPKKIVKIMNTPYKIMLWTVLGLFSIPAAWTQESLSKTVEKTFALSNAGELKMENKYGTITLNGWDKEEVAVSVSITVNHRKKENAKDLLKRIRPEFRSGSDYVSVVSAIANKNTGWFADFFNKTNPIDFDRGHVHIDYEVFLPSKAELRITNRFGDVYIEGWSGPLNATIEHGDLWVGEDLNRVDVILKFGKIRARNMDYASIDLKNGELDMENSKSLRLNSSGSRMDFNSVTSLEIYSNKDNIAMEESDVVYGNLKFTTFNLQRLGNDVDLTLKIADMRINGILQPEAHIALKQESSDISLDVNGFSHEFNAILEQGMVRLPKSFQNVNSNMLYKGKRLREINASYGTGAKGSIAISGKKGIVTLRE
ncbi:MAG: hypothetical protein AAGA86_13350, partial [Bacteroidota bacterium]